MKIAGKVIVVTGGGSGMGRELVLQLLRRGARVVTVDVNEAALHETAALANAGDALSTFVLDVADRAAVEAFATEAIARSGGVDGVINNAGIIQPFVRIKDLEWGAIERVMNVNWVGTLAMTKAFLPHLLQRPEGHIMNISSMGGFLPVPGQAIYGASKAAVKLMTEALYAELQGTTVHVTIVFPGAVATNISSNSGVKMDLPAEDEAKKSSLKPLPADKAAAMMLDGMEANAFRVLVGNDANFLDKLYRLTPRRAVVFIAGQMKQLLKEAGRSSSSS
jgi:short-subunit dehydrogenase